MKLIYAIKHKRYFFIPYLIFLLIGVGVCITLDKKTLHLYCNTYHSDFFDSFFKFITLLGEEKIILPSILVVFILYNRRIALIALLSYGVSGIASQILKRFVFYDMKRPSALLQDDNLHFVEGIDLAQNYSFPSGHTSIAFGFFYFFST